MSKRFAIVALLAVVASSCATGSDRTTLGGQRTVFHNPYGLAGPWVLTDPTTEHPPYIVCNGDRCNYVDKDGFFTRMSDEERRSYRLGLRLSEENRRLNEGQSAPPLDRPTDIDADRDPDRTAARPPQLGDGIPD